MKMSGQFEALATLQLDRGLFGTQSRYGCYGEERNL
jgi:hypothetical protein